jgi:hypothetical protein
LVESVVTLDGDPRGVLTAVSGRHSRCGEFLGGLNSEIVRAPSSAFVSALSGFGVAEGSGASRDRPDDLAAAVDAKDIAAVGRLLGRRDANAVWFNGRDLLESLVRRPLEASLLDVGMGSGWVEMTKYHRAKPTRGTLERSMTSGPLALFRMVREFLPEAELRDHLHLLEDAAEFH